MHSAAPLVGQTEADLSRSELDVWINGDLIVPAPLGRPGRNATTIDVLTTRVNGLRTMLAFTSTDALTRWSRQRIGYARMSGWAVLQMARDNGYEALMVGSVAAARQFLPREVIEALLSRRKCKVH